MPRFEYLKGLSLGKIEVIDSLVIAMQRIITKYPYSPVKPLAKNVLDLLSNQRNSQGQPLITDSTQVTPPDMGQTIYSYDAAAIHFYVLIVNNETVNVDALKTKISDFDSKYYNSDDLQINSLLLDNNLEMVTVGNFSNADKALNYFNVIKDSRYVFTKLQNTGEYYDFAISVDNYPIFYKNKNIQQYLRFFEKNYPGK
jgi:hypothetical protein